MRPRPFLHAAPPGAPQLRTPFGVASSLFVTVRARTLARGAGQLRADVRHAVFGDGLSHTAKPALEYFLFAAEDLE